MCLYTSKHDNLVVFYVISLCLTVKRNITKCWDKEEEKRRRKKINIFKAINAILDSELIVCVVLRNAFTSHS